MPRDRTGTWTQAEWDAADERDAEARLQRPRVPSSSSNPVRCASCGHWGVVSRDTCRACGLPWRPVPIVGPPPVIV